METYTVEIVIENKPAARDPEGEAIWRDLIVKGGFGDVKSVRSGKYLRVTLEAEGLEEAERRVLEMCNALRIYNPLIHPCRVEGRGAKK